MVWGVAGRLFRQGTVGVSLFFALCFSVDARPKVLLVSSEVTPYFYSGGMGHMVSSLAHSLKKNGIDVHVAMPFYSSLSDSIVQASVEQPGVYEAIYFGGEKFRTRLYQEPKTNLPVHFFEHLPQNAERNFFENRSGGRTYSTTVDHITLFDRWGQAIFDFVRKNDFDIIHVQDWQGGFAAHYLKAGPYLNLDSRRDRKILIEIHNAAYHGLNDQNRGAWEEIARRTRFAGQSPFDLGLLESDIVVVNSASYLRDLLDGYGVLVGDYGRQRLLEKFSRGQAIAIGLGADPELWKLDSKDPLYLDRFDMQARAKGKAWLQEQMGFEVNPEIPIAIMSSRLSFDKGYRQSLWALEEILNERKDLQVVVIADGDPSIVGQAKDLERRFPKNFRHKSFDAKLERVTFARADYFFHFPIHEPSGTNHFGASFLGALPVMNPVNGINDVISDRNGVRAHFGDLKWGLPFYLFDRRHEEADRLFKDRIKGAIWEAIELYRVRPQEYRKRQAYAMDNVRTWERPGRAMANFYRHLFANDIPGFAIHSHEDSYQDDLVLCGRMLRGTLGL